MDNYPFEAFTSIDLYEQYYPGNLAKEQQV
jgi:hypothetical protein